jgi:hypothetical protein
VLLDELLDALLLEIFELILLQVQHHLSAADDACRTGRRKEQSRSRIDDVCSTRKARSETWRVIGSVYNTRTSAVVSDPLRAVSLSLFIPVPR